MLAAGTSSTPVTSEETSNGAGGKSSGGASGKSSSGKSNGATKASSASGTSTANFLTKTDATDMISSTVNSFASYFVTAYNKGIDIINSIPGTIQSNSVRVTEALGKKLQDIGNAVKGGEQNADSKNNNDYVSIIKPHFDMLEKLRKQDIVKYKQLVALAELVKTQPASVIYTKITKAYGISTPPTRA